jgi:hypothetical protein
MDLEKIIEDYNRTKPESFDDIQHKKRFVNNLCKDNGIGTISKSDMRPFPFEYSEDKKLFLYIEPWVPQFWSSTVNIDIVNYTPFRDIRGISRIIQPDFEKKGLFVRTLLGEMDDGNIIFFSPY